MDKNEILTRIQGLKAFLIEMAELKRNPYVSNISMDRLLTDLMNFATEFEDFVNNTEDNTVEEKIDKKSTVEQ